MENNHIHQKKLTIKNLLFLSILGLMILIFKFYFIKGDFCHDTCSNINSELDIIRCLDACAINGEDFREPISFKKIIIYTLIILTLSFFIYQFLNNFIIKREGKNKILNLIKKIKQFKDALINGNKYEKDGYRKLEDHE